MIWLAEMDSAMMNRMFGRVRSNVVTKLSGHACDRSGQLLQCFQAQSLVTVCLGCSHSVGPIVGVALRILI